MKTRKCEGQLLSLLHSLSHICVRTCGRAGVRACGRAGVQACRRAGVQACRRAGVRACGRAGVRVGVYVQADKSDSPILVPTIDITAFSRRTLCINTLYALYCIVSTTS